MQPLLHTTERRSGRTVNGNPERQKAKRRRDCRSRGTRRRRSPEARRRRPRRANRKPDAPVGATNERRPQPSRGSAQFRLAASEPAENQPAGTALGRSGGSGRSGRIQQMDLSEAKAQRREFFLPATQERQKEFPEQAERSGTKSEPAKAGPRERLKEIDSPPARGTSSRDRRINLWKGAGAGRDESGERLPLMNKKENPAGELSEAMAQRREFFLLATQERQKEFPKQAERSGTKSEPAKAGLWKRTERD